MSTKRVRRESERERERERKTGKPVKTRAKSKGALNIGRRVKAHRKRAELSLDQLAGLSGVSKAMLSQVEQNKANPTVAVVHRIAEALNTGITDLVGNGPPKRRFQIIRRDDARYLFTSNERCVVRTLSPLALEKDIEFYQIDLQPAGSLDSESHFHNTEEFLTVAKGRVTLKSALQCETLSVGDSAHYSADVNHSISNAGRATARVFLVVKYRSE